MDGINVLGKWRVLFSFQTMGRVCNGPNRRLTRTVEVLKRNVALETVLNRAARALGNLATDADGSALIHAAGSSGPPWVMRANAASSLLVTRSFSRCW